MLIHFPDRVNEFSDEDEEIEFSSGEYDPNNIGGNGSGGYACQHDMRKYRKIDQTENDGEAEDGALGSDSEFENLKDKGSRAKISHVSFRAIFVGRQTTRYRWAATFNIYVFHLAFVLQQRNFKQKIISLLKRFKVPEELDGGGARGPGALSDALFEELDSLSCEGDDSGPDMDSLSVGSTPKPSLRPFFTNSKNMMHENMMGWF